MSIHTVYITYTYINTSIHMYTSAAYTHEQNMLK